MRHHCSLIMMLSSSTTGGGHSEAHLIFSKVAVLPAWFRWILDMTGCGPRMGAQNGFAGKWKDDLACGPYSAGLIFGLIPIWVCLVLRVPL